MDRAASDEPCEGKSNVDGADDGFGSPFLKVDRRIVQLPIGAPIYKRMAVPPLIWARRNLPE